MKRKISIIIATIFMACGIGLIGYTVYQMAESAYENEKLNEAFNEIMGLKETKKVVVTPSDTIVEVEEICADVIPEKTEEEIAAERAAIKDKAVYMDMQLVGKISIPSVDIEDVVCEGTDGYTISYALGHFKETVWPGEEGNFAVCGHRGGKHGKFFKYLPDVKLGDSIFVTDIYGDEYQYVIYDKYIIEPNEFWVLGNETVGRKVITLLTCANSGTQRYVIKGEIVEP